MHTDLDALLVFTRENLDTYWRSVLRRAEQVGPEVVGDDDGAVASLGLGPARLHHLLRRRTLTSKSGAGHYVVDRLDPAWQRIGREALRLRELPDTPGLYPDPAVRGRDALALARWLVEDGTRA